MGRRLKGPRLVKGTWSAVYSWRDSSGKQHQIKESLRTKDHSTALSRWPAAYSRCKAKAQGQAVSVPIHPDQIGWVINDRGEEQQVRAADVLSADELQLTWPQAWEIHATRKEEKTGRSLSKSTAANAERAWREIEVTAPSQVQVSDVRRYVDKLKARGLGATTISNRCNLLGAITQSLIKGAYMPSEAVNPWHRVDTSATSKGRHHRPATVEEIRLIAEQGDQLMLLQLYLGLRVGELCSRRPEHLKDGVLSICTTDSWRPKTISSERDLPVPGWCRSLPKMISVSTYQGRLRRLCPGLTTHGLRGAWRTASREAGITTEMAEHLIGHSQSHQLADVYGLFSAEAKLQSMQKVWKVLDDYCKQSNLNCNHDQRHISTE